MEGSPGGEVEVVASSALGFTVGLAKLRFNALSCGLFLGSLRSCTLTWVGAIPNMGSDWEKNLL